MLLLAGCVSRPRQPVAAEPFVFRSLDLRQQTGSGQPDWDLSSPEARYDLVRQLAQVRRPRGSVYRNGKPHITISAELGTVIGDGQAIQLEGDVRILVRGARPIQIRGDQLRWIPGERLMVIDRRPQASDQRFRIRAQLVRYRLDKDLLELRGAPLLEEWSNPQPLLAKRPSAPIRLHVASLDWRPDQGDLRAPGPVRGERFSATPKPRQPLTLLASGLSGNLRRGYLDLLEPVRLQEGDGSGWLQARRVRWAIEEQWLASDQPFAGQLRNLRARGDGLRINLSDQTVLVPEGCRLDQPASQLSAARCLWHWPSGRFAAEGDVVLRRTAYQQITRASRLNGRIGASGQAEFFSPGGRVHSRITLPPQPPRKQAATGAGPRVVF